LDGSDRLWRWSAGRPPAGPRRRRMRFTPAAVARRLRRPGLYGAIAAASPARPAPAPRTVQPARPDGRTDLRHPRVASQAPRPKTPHREDDLDGQTVSRRV